jgi:beta-glucanase (GH16 family)
MTLKWSKISLPLKALTFLVVIGIAGLGTAYAGENPITKLHDSLFPTTNLSASDAPQIMLGTPQNDPSFAKYPTWMQDFTSDKASTLDSRSWEIFQGPADSNNEAEYYTSKLTNVRISGGALILEAIKQQEPQGYQYSSARVDTQNKKTFLYGRLDITAKMPTSVGTWPAAWLLPANNKYEDLSPTSDAERYLNGGELDLIEQVGTLPNTEYGIVHTKSDLSNPGGVGAYKTIAVDNSKYNTYTLLWTPTSLTFEVNNVPFFTYNKTTGAGYGTWPFDQPFYLILNLALGGSWGGEDTAQYPGNGINDAALPATMSIQSIYYYPYAGS